MAYRTDVKKDVLRFMRPVCVRGTWYWQTTEGLKECTKFEVRLWKTCETVLKQLAAGRHLILDWREQGWVPQAEWAKRQAVNEENLHHTFLDYAANDWVHVAELNAAVRSEREACALIADAALKAGFDPLMPAHIANEIRSQLFEPKRFFYRCEACGKYPRRSERATMLDPRDVRWKCVDCFDPTGVTRAHKK